ncbi:MAG: Dot/Icm T4SS effector AnkK/LegA5 [Legionellales bacterium]
MMTHAYLLKNIVGLETSIGSRLTGHTVHSVRYQVDKKTSVPIFYKENKHGNAQASVNEVAFSELARLFMCPHSTPPYHVVKNSANGEVVGVASHHIQSSIAQREDYKNVQFFNIHGADASYQLTPVPVSSPVDIPFTFLNKLPHGFFAQLMDDKKRGLIAVDMESLANVLVGKYTLEDDDLHKGNIGIYITLKDGKHQVVFFNIDHDLAMSDSLMSFFKTRLHNIGHGEKAFNMTARDLNQFPDLQDSANHYWPTRKRILVKYGDNKIYSSATERDAFKALKNDAEFNRYKWKRLLKSIFIPDELIRATLALHLDGKKPQDAAHINLIALSMNERLIKLRSVLFSMPQFRDYMNSAAGMEDMQAIKQELVYSINGLGAVKNQVQRQFKARMLRQLDAHQAYYLRFFNPQTEHSIQNGDTPLHVAIRLGSFRFEQSHRAFSEYINKPNDNGEVPIDSAVRMAKNYKPGSEQVDQAKDPLCVIKYLLKKGAALTPKVTQLLLDKGINLEKYEFRSQYFKRKLRDYAGFKALITEIGHDQHLTLKAKKMIVVKVAKAHLSNLSLTARAQFQLDLNGTETTPIAPEFLFISQLRSTLWIIRMLRGLYGNSTTKIELNALLHPPKSDILHEIDCVERFFKRPCVAPVAENQHRQDPLCDFIPKI